MADNDRKQLNFWFAIAILFASSPNNAMSQDVAASETTLKAVVFEGTDDSFRLNLQTLFSGQETSFVFRFKNGTNHRLVHVKSKVGCPCIRVSGLDDKSIAPDESVDVYVLIKPADQKGFAQRIQIMGETEDNIFETAVIVRAEVQSPIVIPTVIHTKSSLEHKTFDMIVHTSSQRVKIDPKSIVLDSDAINIVEVKIGVRGEAIVSMAFRPGLDKEDSFSLGNLRVGFSIEGGRRAMEVEQRVRFGAYSGIEISPSVVTFEREGDFMRASLIIRDHRTDEHRENEKMSFRLVPLESREDVDFQFSDSELKPIGIEGRAFIVKLKIATEDLNKIRSEYTHLMLGVPKRPEPNRNPRRLDQYYLFKADFD